jgi:hypothetical protein
MKSMVTNTGNIELPLITGEYSMIEFNLETFAGLTNEFKHIAQQMMKGITHNRGKAYFTIHGKKLKKGETLRRGGAHIDGNYEPHLMTFGGGGWKVGQDGFSTESPIHKRQYIKDSGGIVLASNYRACNGWVGDFDGLPGKGGDCTHIGLGDHFELNPNQVYYGNNHFIHESLAMKNDVHRVFVRITMPENHKYVI